MEDQGLGSTSQKNNRINSPCVLIFHCKLGALNNDEGASEDELLSRILYSYGLPTTAEQLTILGYIEAVIGFVAPFTQSSKELEMITLSRRIFGTFQCEPDIWIILGIPNDDPAVSIKKSIFIPVIRDMYLMFKLLYGGIDFNLRHMEEEQREFANDGMDALLQIQKLRKDLRKNKLQDPTLLHNLLSSPSSANRLALLLEEFIPTYLKLIDFTNLHLFHAIDGIHYCHNVSKKVYLSLQQMLNTVLLQNRNIKATVVCVDGRLLWTSVPSIQDTRMLLKYFRLREERARSINTCHSSSSNTTTWSSTSRNNNEIWTKACQKSRGGTKPSSEPRGFMTVDGNFHDNLWRHKVYLENSTSDDSVILWQDGRFSIAVVVNSGEDNLQSSSVRESLEQQSFNEMLSNEINSNSMSDFGDFDFLYYNYVNCSLMVGGKNFSPAGVLPESCTSLCNLPALSLIDEMHETLCSTVETKPREMLLETASSSREWVSGKVAADREVYVVLGLNKKKKYSIDQVEEKIEKAYSLLFGNAFFQ